MKNGTAIWGEGEPQNLQAAASDALVWLRWLYIAGVLPNLPNGKDQEERLGSAIAALEGMLHEAGVPTTTEATGTE